MDALVTADKRRLLHELQSAFETLGRPPLSNVELEDLQPDDFDVLAVASVVYGGANTVVLVRRAETPNEWVIPGGVVDPGEGLLSAAKREVKEETGLEISLEGIVRLGLEPSYSPIAFRNVNLARFGKESIRLLFVNFVASRAAGDLDCSHDPSGNILEAKEFEKVPFDSIAHVYKVLFVQQKLSPGELNDYPPVEFAPGGEHP